MSKRKQLEKPAWLKEFRRRVALFETIELAFEIECNCEVCQRLRNIAREMDEEFLPPTSPKSFQEVTPAWQRSFQLKSKS